MKRIYGGTVALLVTLSLFFNVSANSISAGSTNGPIKEAINTKVYCNATLEDDFAEDSVIVVINKEYTQRNMAFARNSFQFIQAQYVTELTTPIDNLYINDLTKTKEVDSVERVAPLQLTNREEFRQIIEIKLQKAGKANVLKAIKELEKLDFVQSAEPNYYFYPENLETTTLIENTGLPDHSDNSVQESAIPNDEKFSSQYSLNAIQAPQAWDITKGSKSVRVGVIDSGISNHPDLSNNLVAGWDFVSNNSTTTDDTDGHGTHVAGIIGASGNNGIGICGTNWNVSLVPLQVADYTAKPSANGGHPLNGAAITKAIDYARTHNIPVINCSFGYYGNVSAYETQMKAYGGIIVCAAGNGDKDGKPINTDKSHHYPSCSSLDNVISVTATNSQDVLASFSNYGVTSVDLAAPGVSVLSTLPGGKYGNMSGTSMAAPHVTGVAALLKSKFPNITTAQIKKAIMDGVDKKSNLSGKCVTGGRLNAYKALKKIADKYFTVRYNANGGSGSMADTKVYYGITTNIRKNTFTHSGYDFDCWYIKRSSDGKWRYINPNNTSQSEWYTEGKQPSGWVKYRYDNGISISKTVSNAGEVVTFYAQWKKYFTIRYNANGGSGSMADTKVTYGVSTKLRPNAFSRSGYDFDCWYIKRSSDGKWRYINPNNASQSEWYTEGKQPSGWVKYRYDNGISVAKTVSNPGEVVTFYAQWKKYFIIRYNANGGSGSMADTKVTYGVSTKLRPNAFTRSGYKFDCWYIKRSSDGKWRYINPNNTSQSEWYTEGKQPSGWVKYRYDNEISVAYTVSNPGEVVTFYAQWK